MAETVCTLIQLVLLWNKNGMLAPLLQQLTGARGEHQESVVLGRLERCWGPCGCEQGDPRSKMQKSLISELEPLLLVVVLH